MQRIEENSPAVKFLDQFEPARRSGIAQLFYIAIREGATDPSLVVESVGAAVRRRDARDAASRGFIRLASLLNAPEAQAFAQYCLDRESMPAEERAIIKIENRKRYQREYLKARKPTIKQTNYLRNLACMVVPQNMLEASELIDTYRTRGCVWP